MISGVDDILTESEFTLGTDEIPYFTHEYQDNIRNAKSAVSDEDDEELDDEDEDEDYDDTDEDDDQDKGNGKEETAATTVQDLILKEKVLYAILGALVAGVGLASGLLLSDKNKRPYHASHEEMQQVTMMMLMTQMMKIQNDLNHNGNGNNDKNGEFHEDEKMSASHARMIPSHQQFLDHVKRYGGERMPSEDLKPGDLTYKLKPYRNHEIWKVEKHMNGDIAEAYKTCEYTR